MFFVSSCGSGPDPSSVAAEDMAHPTAASADWLKLKSSAHAFEAMPLKELASVDVWLQESPKSERISRHFEGEDMIRLLRPLNLNRPISRSRTTAGCDLVGGLDLNFRSPTGGTVTRTVDLNRGCAAEDATYPDIGYQPSVPVDERWLDPDGR